MQQMKAQEEIEKRKLAMQKEMNASEEEEEGEEEASHEQSSKIEE